VEISKLGTVRREKTMKVGHRPADHNTRLRFVWIVNQVLIFISFVHDVCVPQTMTTEGVYVFFGRDPRLFWVLYNSQRFERVDRMLLFHVGREKIKKTVKTLKFRIIRLATKIIGIRCTTGTWHYTARSKINLINKCLSKYTINILLGCKLCIIYSRVA